VANVSVGYPSWDGVHVGPPYLGSALVCESVLEDVPGLTNVGGIHSSELVAVVRGQTRTTLAREGEELFLWLRIYADGAPGEYELDVRFLSPSGGGLARQVARSTLTFDGVSAVIPIRLLTTDESGVHHFEIGLDRMLLARVPFEVQIVEAAGA
jgi:hypothetical protein